MFTRSITLAVTLFALLATNTSAITIEEVVANNLTARGGVTNIKNYGSAKATGTMSTPGGEMAFTRMMKGSKMFRMDMTVQGMSMTKAFDGSVAWEISPMSGNKPQKSSPEETKDVLNQADWEGAFIDTETKGFQLELLGSEDLDGSTVYKVKITSRDGDVEYVYIDAITWLVVRKDQSSNMGGTPVEVQTYFSDYREFKGVQVPMITEIKYQGQTVMTMTIANIDTTTDLPDSLFMFPG